MSVRNSFVETFSEDQAMRIEQAAYYHLNGINSANKGSDPFKWACLIVIGYQCVEKYPKDHSITVSQDDFKKWCLEHGELGSHDGDCDYIALFCGMYSEYIKDAKEAKS